MQTLLLSLHLNSLSWRAVWTVSFTCIKSDRRGTIALNFFGANEEGVFWSLCHLWVMCAALVSFLASQQSCLSARVITGLQDGCSSVWWSQAQLSIFINVILLVRFNEYFQIIMHSVVEIKWYTLSHIILLFYVFSARDAKMRECFEKIFPELKKQREDKERVQKFVFLFLF